MKYEKTLIDIKTEIVSSDTMYSLILINAETLSITLNGTRCYLAGYFLLCLTPEDSISVESGHYEAVNLQFLPFFYNVNLSHEVIGMPLYEQMRARHGYPDFHLFRTRSADYIGILHLKKEEYDITATFFDRAQRHIAAHNSDGMWSCNTRSALISILQTAESAHHAPGAIREDEILRYIRENPAEDLSLSELCQRFHTNRTTLSEKVKSLTGLTPAQYVLETRLNLSCPDLLFTSVPIQIVAEKYGFSDPNYYIRAFKKRFGKSPLQYRKDSYDNRRLHQQSYRALAVRIRDFENYIKRGLGCAVLMLKKEKEVSSFRKVFVDFLLGNDKFVRRFGFYEKTLIESFPDNTELAAQISAELFSRVKGGRCYFSIPLLIEYGYREDILTHLEGEYAKEYAHLTELLKKHADSKDTDIIANRYANIARALLDYLSLDDTRILRILYDMADLYHYSDHPPVPEKNNPIFSLRNGVGQTRFLALLRKAEAGHPFGEKLDLYKVFKETKPLPHPLKAEHVLKSKTLFSNEYPALSAAFADADPEIHIAVSREALAETDTERKNFLLSFFTNAASDRRQEPVFPLSPEPLISIAENTLSKTIGECTYTELCCLQILCRMRSPAVRSFGEKLVCHAESVPDKRTAESLKTYGLRMCIEGNYTAADKQQFVDLLTDSEQENIWIDVFSDLLAKHTPDLPIELVPYLLHNAHPIRERVSLVRALAKTNTFTEELLLECLYDANAETRQIAEQYQKEMTAVLTFEKDLQKGLGRAFLTVKAAADKEPYRKAIISFTLNLEGKRHQPNLDRYLFDLISLFPDSDAIFGEITPHLFAYLKKSVTLTVLPLLLRLGREQEVHEVMEDMYRFAYKNILEQEIAGAQSKDMPAFCQYFTCACATLVRELRGGEAQTRQILNDISDFYDYSDTPYIPTRWNPLLAAGCSDETLLCLAKETAKNHRNGEKLLAELESQMDAATLPPKENLTIDDLLTTTRENSEKYYAVAKAFTMAPDSLVRALSKEILKENDLKKLADLISFFNFGRRAPNGPALPHLFPYDPTPLIKIAESNTAIDPATGFLPPEIGELYMFLTQIRHPAVRTWGEKLRTNPPLFREGIIAFEANYIPEDGEILEKMVKDAPEQHRTHWLHAAGRLIANNAEGISEELIRHCFYNTTDSNARLHILQAWQKRGTLPEEIRSECRYDTYEEIRTLVTETPDKATEGGAKTHDAYSRF